MEYQDEKMYHQFLVRLDDELSMKLVHFAKEKDMKITGVIRRSLRQLFENEIQNKEVKKKDTADENRNQ